MKIKCKTTYKCKCGKEIYFLFNGGNSHNNYWMYEQSDNKNIIKCQCGREYSFKIDASFTARQINLPKGYDLIGKVFIHEGRKMVLTESDISDMNQNPIKYLFIGNVPHEDGDYSYLCGMPYCKCSE